MNIREFDRPWDHISDVKGLGEALGTRETLATMAGYGAIGQVCPKFLLTVDSRINFLASSRLGAIEANHSREGNLKLRASFSSRNFAGQRQPVLEYHSEAFEKHGSSHCLPSIDEPNSKLAKVKREKKLLVILSEKNS